MLSVHLSMFLKSVFIHNPGAICAFFSPGAPVKSRRVAGETGSEVGCQGNALML